MLTFFRTGDVTDIECKVNNGGSSLSDLGFLASGRSLIESSSSLARFVVGFVFNSLTRCLNVVWDVAHCSRISRDASGGYGPPAEKLRAISRMAEILPKSSEFSWLAYSLGSESNSA